MPTSQPVTELWVRRQLVQMTKETEQQFTVTLDGYVTTTAYNNHITDTNNPHSVTATQVGALTQTSGRGARGHRIFIDGSPTSRKP